MTYIKLAGRSNHSFLQPFWWITFFKHICALNSVMECIIELNWLWKHIKKVRTSQPGILVLNCSSYIYIYIYIKNKSNWLFHWCYICVPLGIWGIPLVFWGLFRCSVTVPLVFRCSVFRGSWFYSMPEEFNLYF